MTSVITLTLLAVAPIVVCSLAWWYQFGRGSATHDEHPGRNDQGGHTTPPVKAGTAWEQATQWVEDGRAVFESIRWVLQEYDQTTEAARAVLTDRERLQQTCEALRAEIRQLRADMERGDSEWIESVRWFATVMREAAARLQIEPPPASAGGSH